MACFSELASRHADALEYLEEKHLEWTLDVSMDESETDHGKPNVLSPFLPSQIATMSKLIEFLPTLGSCDCIVDIGCGDGRVLVGASQQTGCRGVGVDISEDCINAAINMVSLEDSLVKDEVGPLCSRLQWIHDDCTKNRCLIEDIIKQYGDTGHIYIYLYIYPTLLGNIQSQIEDASRMTRTDSERGEISIVSVITAGYHFEEWPSGFESVIAPIDSRAGPNASPVEIRRLNPALERGE